METGVSLGEGDAIDALGNLFRVTEVHLWDDSGVGLTKASSHTRCDGSEEDFNSFNNLDARNFPKMNEFTNIEDMELAQEMDALGLPISFSTNKQKRNVVTSLQRKGVKGKNLSSQNNPQVSDWSKRKQIYSSSSQPSCDSLISSPSCIVVGNKSTSLVDVKEEMTKANVQCNGGLAGEAAAAIKGTFEKLTLDRGNDLILMDDMANEKTEGSISSHAKVSIDPSNVNYECTPQIALEDINLVSKLQEDRNLESETISNDYKIENIDVDLASTSCVDSTELFQCTTLDGINHSGSYDDWTAVWDTFYMRYYFYNCNTKESTWYPPPGFEHFSYTSSSGETAVDTVKDKCGLSNKNDVSFRMQENDSFAGEQNNGNLPVQSSHGLTSQLSQTAGNFTSNITLLSPNGGSDHLEENMLECGSYASKLGEDFTVDPFHSSDSHSFDESLACAHNQSALEKACPSLFRDCMNTQADGVDESLEPENNITFVDSYKESHNIPFSFYSTSCITTNGSDLNDSGTLMLPTDKASSEGGPDCYQDVIAVNHVKKVRRIRSCQKKLSESQYMMLPEEIQGFSSSITRYWRQRYSLFSKFDYGIKMDEEGWFSVTPECIARHHASHCSNGTVIDCFTGVGGNAIQFAIKNNHVIAIDIDPLKIDHAHHNATIYGVEDRIDFIQGDFLQLAAKLKGDVIFLSPPWGGPDYVKVQSYNIQTMLRPQNGSLLFNIARMIAPKIVMFLPRNVDINQLAELSLSAHHPWELEVEKNFLNGKLKTVTAYFSDVTKSNTIMQDIHS